MLCINVSCLSSGLAKNNKIMSMFVLFSRLFGNFESLAFYQPYIKAVKEDVLVNCSNVQPLSNNFSKKRGYFE